MTPCDLGDIKANQATALIVNDAIKNNDVETIGFINDISRQIELGKNNFTAGSYEGVAQVTKGRQALESFALSKLTDNPIYKKSFFDAIKSQTAGVYYFSKRAVGLAEFADKMAIDYTRIDAATMQQVFGESWQDIVVDLQNVYKNKAIGDYLYATSLDQTISRTLGNRVGRKAWEAENGDKVLNGQFNSLEDVFKDRVSKRMESGLSQEEAIHTELKSIYGDSVDSRLMWELIDSGASFKTYSDIITYQAINYGAMDLNMAVDLIDKFSYKFAENITDTDKEKFWISVTNAPDKKTKQALVEEWYSNLMTDDGKLVKEKGTDIEKKDIIKTSIFATNAYSINPKANPFDLAQVFVLADKYNVEAKAFEDMVSKYYIEGTSNDLITKIIADGGERDLYHVLGAKPDFIKQIYGDATDIFKAFNLSEAKYNGFINDEYSSILETVLNDTSDFYNNGKFDREAFKRVFLQFAEAKKETGYFQKQVTDYIKEEFYKTQPNGQTLFENVVLKNSSNNPSELAGKKVFVEYELSPSTNDGQALRKVNELAYEANSIPFGTNIEDIKQFDYNSDLKAELLKIAKEGKVNVILNKTVPGFNGYDKDLIKAGVTVYVPQRGTRYVYRDGQVLMQSQRRETLNKLFGDLANQDVVKGMSEEQEALFNDYISEYISQEATYQGANTIATMETLADIGDFRKNYIAIRNRVKNTADWTGYKPANKTLIDKAATDIESFMRDISDVDLGKNLKDYLQESFGTEFTVEPLIGDRERIKGLMQQIAYGDQGAHVPLAQEIGLIDKDKVPFDLQIPTQKIALYRDTVASVGWQVPSDNPYGKLFFDTLNKKSIDVKKAISLMQNKSTLQDGIKIIEEGLGDEQKRQLLGWVDELASVNGMYTDLIGTTINGKVVERISQIPSDTRMQHVMPDVISTYFDEMERVKQAGTNFDYNPYFEEIPQTERIFNEFGEYTDSARNQVNKYLSNSSYEEIISKAEQYKDYEKNFLTDNLSLADYKRLKSIDKELDALENKSIFDGVEVKALEDERKAITDKLPNPKEDAFGYYDSDEWKEIQNAAEYAKSIASEDTEDVIKRFGFLILKDVVENPTAAQKISFEAALKELKSRGLSDSDILQRAAEKMVQKGEDIYTVETLINANIERIKKANKSKAIGVTSTPKRNGSLLNQGFLNKVGIQPDVSNSVKLATTKDYDYVISTDFGSQSVARGVSRLKAYKANADTIIDGYYAVAKQSAVFGASELDMRNLQREYQGRLLQLKNTVRDEYGALFRYVSGGPGSNTRISELFKGLENELFYIPNEEVAKSITPEIIDNVKGLYAEEFAKTSTALKSRGGKVDVSKNVERIMTNGYTTVIIDGMPYKVSIEDAIRSLADKLSGGKAEGIEEFLRIANSDSLEKLTLEAQRNVYGVLHSSYMARAYKTGIDEYHNVLRGLFGDIEDQTVVRFLDEYNLETVATHGAAVKDAYAKDVQIPKALIESGDNAETSFVKARAFDRVSRVAREGVTLTPDVIRKEVKQAFTDVKVAVSSPEYPKDLADKIENVMGTYARLSNIRQSDGTTLLQLVDGFDTKAIGPKANELIEQFRQKVANEQNIRSVLSNFTDPEILNNVSINGTPINTVINEVPDSVQVASSYLSYNMKNSEQTLKKSTDIFDEIIRKTYKDNDIVKNQMVLDDIQSDFTSC